jgi:hypothetical protein
MKLSIQEALHAGGMPTPNRARLDNLPLKELHPVILTQDPGFSHPVVLDHGEQPLEQLNGHRPPPLINRSSCYLEGASVVTLKFLYRFRSP